MQTYNTQANNWIAPIAKGTTLFWRSNLPAAEFSSSFANTVDVWEHDSIISSDEISWMLMRASASGPAGAAAVSTVTRTFAAVVDAEARVEALREQRDAYIAPFVTVGGVIGGALCVVAALVAALLGVLGALAAWLVLASLIFVVGGRALGELVGGARHSRLHPEHVSAAAKADAELAAAKKEYKEALEAAARASVATPKPTSGVFGALGGLSTPRGVNGVLSIG